MNDQQQVDAWYLVKKQIGPKGYPDDVNDIVAIKAFLDKFLGAQDAALISTYIGTGVAYSAIDPLDRREAAEDSVRRSMKELIAEDAKRSYGTKTGYGKSVDDAYAEAKDTLLPEYYKLLVKWGEAKEAKEDKSLQENSDQDAARIWNDVKNAATPSPATSFGIGALIGLLIVGYLLAKSITKE